MPKKSARDLVADAKARIDNLSVEQVKQEMTRPGTVVIDIREESELVQSGKIPGSVHIPRGRLEFSIDPAMNPKAPPLKDDQRIILHCAGGGRSALAGAQLKEMGFTNVAHLETGFGGWKEAGGEIEQVSEPKWR